MAELNLATMTVGDATFTLQDVTINLTQASLKTTATSSLYDTFLPGRLGGTVSGNVFVDDDTRPVIAAAFLNQSALNVLVELVLSQGGSGAETYTADAIITSCNHSMTTDNVDMYAMEFQLTGTIT